MHALCLCLPGNTSDDSGGASIEVNNMEDVCEVAYMKIFPVLLSFAVITNTINAMVLIRIQTKHSPTPSRVYLFWLAVTHCLTCGPLLVGAAIRDRTSLLHGWAVYFAYIENPLYNALNCVCIYIIVGLSVDRYMALCDIHNYSSIKQFRNVPKRILLAFIAPFLFYLPLCFIYVPEQIENSDRWRISFTETLVYDNYLWKVWAVIVQIIHRVIPAITLTVINAKLLSTLTKLRQHRSKMRKNSFNRSRRDRQLVQVLLALTIIFLVTNIPSAVLYIYYVFSGAVCEINANHETLRAVSNCLEMTGYSCDFFLYFLINREYRRGLRLLYRTVTKQFRRRDTGLSISKMDSITNTGD